MNSEHEFIEVERRIRALTTILKKLDYHVTPSSSDHKDVPSFLRHFATLLTTGDRRSHDAKRVVAVTGFHHPDGTTSTLVVTQNPLLKSDAKNLCIEDVSRSGKSFDEIVNLNRDDNVDLNEYISDLWAALTHYRSHPDCYTDLHNFVIYRSYRKLFNRVKQDEKLWGVNVARIIFAWTPAPNELDVAPRWLKIPDWLDSLVALISPEDFQRMKTRNGGKEVEFSSATLGFWAWLLGDSLLNLEVVVKSAVKKVKNDTQGFKKDLAEIADWCHTLHHYVNWGAHIVDILLTRTSLARAFNLKKTVQSNVGDDNDDCAEDHDDDDNAEDDLADMSREINESDGHLVLRHLRAVFAWSTALDSLTSEKNLSIINGKLDIGLLRVPHPGNEIADIEDITGDFFKRFPDRSSPEFRNNDTANLKRCWKPTFPGTIHAEATLMGLLQYFSSLDPSSRVDYWSALEDPQMAKRMEVLIGPTVMSTDKCIGVGKKCCWCCSTLGSILSQEKHVSIKLPGSHGIIYPWSPPRIGLDVSVLRMLEEQLWVKMHKAIEQAGFRITLSRQSSGSSSVEEAAPKTVRRTKTRRFKP